MQIFIPTAGQDGSKFAEQPFTDLKQELTGFFGGVTIYARGPVKGIWKPSPGQEETDDMIIYEVLVQHPDMSYWSSLKGRLERTFGQQEILMRYFNIEVVK
ncbi:hypothetical protein [Dyadobacter bucti]|uniref:hypothetical protein n=1 Tax=Dyadobacter bucti TaxID=2572203 RepID=UPI00110898BA|nr:hypothetical protein [Dyadobacter bucti]